MLTKKTNSLCDPGDEHDADGPDYANIFKGLSAGQQAAVKLAASAPIMVLTGGPGCGKTFTTRAMVRLWKEKQFKRVALCTPTGKFWVAPEHVRQGFTIKHQNA